MTGTTPAVRYRLLPSDLSGDALEQEVMARWTKEGVFAASQALRADAPSWTFFEGPPTANGKPGIHHVFARTVKDLFCRHRAMLGYHVPRKAGWDTHGLPVEIEVEKALGISGKQDIERVGVAEFNRRCRESVWTYKGDWEQVSERMGYWLDYSDPYITYANAYVESVWWALKTLHTRNLLYLGHKILPYCARCGTALSSHEVAQGYEDVEDPSVYVALDLQDAAGGPGPVRRRIIVWTTTPWTLVSNVALAVHPELTYVELRKKHVSDWTIILADARAGAVLGNDYAQRWDVVATMKGADLVGQRYRRPLDWIEYPAEGAREVIVGEEFVSAEDGSGVVHMAPAFGADDYAAGQRHRLAFVNPVNGRGEFPAAMPLVGGRFVKDADPLIIEELQRRDQLWKAQQFVHSYPHCWRCGTPLLYYARSSWFVRTTAFKDEMMARNAAVDWNPPEVGAGRFGSWLENNIDWAISRDRYWGTPLPVWVNDADPAEVEVIGSFAELAEKVGAPLPADFDPHKPHIDGYTWPARSGTGTMRRVPEVIDTWFDSGSMPFAQWGYPHQPGSAERVARYYPAEFIAEGVDQTRGWFYSLLAIATGLGDALPNNGGGAAGAGATAGTGAGATAAAPYRAVVVNDLVLDANGQKMSKSRGNTVDPRAVMARHGADAVRLFLMASSQVWVPRRFDEAVIRETAGRFLVTLRNVYSGIFAQYANFGWAPGAADPAVAERPVLDRWILSRLATVEAEVDATLTRFDATAAARVLMEFVTEDVANWYVRLSRSRFYEVDGADHRAAFATLHEVLVVTCRLLAPFAPFISDWIHQELTGTSVHLAPYRRGSSAGRPAGAPAAAPVAAPDAELEAAMGAARTLATLGRAARETAGIKVRQPLAALTCVAPGIAPAWHAMIAPLVAAELNIKTVTFADSAADWVRLEGKANFPVLGKIVGPAMKATKPIVEGLDQAQLRAIEAGGSIEVEVPGYGRLALDASRVTITARASTSLVVQQGEGLSVALDPAVTPALRAEGMAREVVSRVQRLRKESGLAVSDRIRLVVAGPAEVQEALRAHAQWIAGETLARECVITDALPASPPWPATAEVELDGPQARIALTQDS
ncbi:MAG: isoleucine--tRNA ligase [Gemmatimonadaceae bacterium]|nr:isoleucine--tRNA ligase [Gemmatimonadaceae bacterium]